MCILLESWNATCNGFHVSAVDDTKVHRSSPEVWGTCTFPEYTARCPNHATTVRAPNWVVLGALLHNPDQPAWFLPQAGRQYFRKSQLPGGRNPPSQRHPFRTKCELAVELLRAAAEAVGGSHGGASTVPTPWVRWSGRRSCRSRDIPDRVPHPAHVAGHAGVQSAHGPVEAEPCEGMGAPSADDHRRSLSGDDQESHAQRCLSWAIEQVARWEQPYEHVA